MTSCQPMGVKESDIIYTGQLAYAVMSTSPMMPHPVPTLSSTMMSTIPDGAEATFLAGCGVVQTTVNEMVVG